MLDLSSGASKVMKSTMQWRRKEKERGEWSSCCWNGGEEKKVGVGGVGEIFIKVGGCYGVILLQYSLRL